MAANAISNPIERSRYMGDLWREVTRYVNQSGTQQWLIVTAVVIVVGLLCMRGLGSRSSY